MLLLPAFAPIPRFYLMLSLGTCWFIHEHVKYEFNLQFEVPVTYPETAPEIEIPSLDGKTAKIYRFSALQLQSHHKAPVHPLNALQGWQNLHGYSLQAFVEQKRPSIRACALYRKLSNATNFKFYSPFFQVLLWVSGRGSPLKSRSLFPLESSSRRLAGLQGERLQNHKPRRL